MSFLDVIVLAASNLWRRKLRTFLTVLGVIIGTASIVIMIALGLGGLEQFDEEVMQNFNLTQIQIYNYGGMGTESSLTESTIGQMKALPGVKSATGVIELPAYLVMGKYENSQGSVYGVDPVAMGFEYMEGREFSDGPQLEIVLGKDARQFFTDPREGDFSMMGGFAMGSVMMGGDDGSYEEPTGPDVDWLDQKLMYYPYYHYEGVEDEFTPDRPAPKEYTSRISGIIDSQQYNYNMYISQSAADKIIRENRKLLAESGLKEGSYNQAYVNAQSVDDVEQILGAIKEMGFEAYSDLEWIDQMKEEQLRQQSQLVAIGLISLFVSAIGIANTMLASILERKREIGVMKVIGLSVNKINLMFLVEAALIGLSGGLIGLIISYVVGGFVNMGGSEMNFLGLYFAEGVRLSIPWWLALGAITIATGVGVLSGLYPAYRATKMSPLEAIRSGE